MLPRLFKDSSSISYMVPSLEIMAVSSRTQLQIKQSFQHPTLWFKVRACIFELFRNITDFMKERSHSPHRVHLHMLLWFLQQQLIVNGSKIPCHHHPETIRKHCHRRYLFLLPSFNRIGKCKKTRGINNAGIKICCSVVIFWKSNCRIKGERTIRFPGVGKGCLILCFPNTNYMHDSGSMAGLVLVL